MGCQDNISEESHEYTLTFSFIKMVYIFCILDLVFFLFVVVVILFSPKRIYIGLKFIFQIKYLNM